jgi:hypothetical protein
MPTPALSPSDLPVSPTRNSVFRVQKPAPSSRQNGRKQSLDPAHLARIDPNSVNIVNAYNNSNHMDVGMAPNGVNTMASHGTTPPMSGMAFVPALPTSGYQQPGVISHGPPLGYALVPIHSHVNSPPLSMTQQPGNGHPSSPPNSTAPPLTNGALRSCCAPAPARAHQVQHPQPTAQPKKSCCGGGSNEEPQPKPTFATHQRALSNGNVLNQLQPSFMDTKQQQQQLQRQHEPFASYPTSTVFTYPANLGTWNQPLNPAMWAQLQHMPQAQPNGAPFPDSLPLTPNGDTAGLGTSHECSCGPGCQCVGCLAHPFNEETLQYVGGAWDYDADVPQGSNMPDKNYSDTAAAMNGNPAPVGQTNGHGINGNGTNGHMTNGAQQPANPEESSPTQAQTPSDASGFNEELPVGDFMFVNLPFPGALGMDADSCGGSSAFCPCGDDCECVGCVIHNARPLDARQFEE